MAFIFSLNLSFIISWYFGNLLWIYLHLTCGTFLFMNAWCGFILLTFLEACFFLLFFYYILVFHYAGYQPWVDLIPILQAFHSFPCSNISTFDSQEKNIHDGIQAHILRRASIPNSVRSNSDFTPGRPLNCWRNIFPYQHIWP